MKTNEIDNIRIKYIMICDETRAFRTRVRSACFRINNNNNSTEDNKINREDIICVE